MKLDDFKEIESNDKALEILDALDLNAEEKSYWRNERWNYLYEKYKPSEEHIKARREYGRNR